VGNFKCHGKNNYLYPNSGCFAKDGRVKSEIYKNERGAAKAAPHNFRRKNFMTTTTPYFYAYNAIFDAPVSSSAKLVYTYLCKCANAEGKCFPSHKNISDVCGIGVTTIKKSLNELESAGLIKIQGQARPDSGRRANLYTLVKEAVKGFFVAYAVAFTEKLTTKARLVYLYFCRLASDGNTAYPSHKTTAKACGLSVAGVRLAIDELEAAGLIERQAQFRENGGQRSNLYTIISEPKAAEIITTEITTDDNEDAVNIQPDEVSAAFAIVANSTHPLINFIKCLLLSLFFGIPANRQIASYPANGRLLELFSLMKNIYNDVKNVIFRKRVIKKFIGT